MQNERFERRTPSALPWLHISWVIQISLWPSIIRGSKIWGKSTSWLLVSSQGGGFLFGFVLHKDFCLMLLFIWTHFFLRSVLFAGLTYMNIFWTIVFVLFIDFWAQLLLFIYCLVVSYLTKIFAAISPLFTEEQYCFWCFLITFFHLVHWSYCGVPFTRANTTWTLRINIHGKWVDSHECLSVEKRKDFDYSWKCFTTHPSDFLSSFDIITIVQLT